MRNETDADTATAMHERTGESRLKIRILLRSNRVLVASVLTGCLFVAFVAVATVFSPSFVEKIESGDVIETLFATMITVIVTGTTLVVTIGELVLTQENGPLGDQHERMGGSMAVREIVTDLTGSPSPTDPAAFLSGILAVATQRSRQLRASTDETDDVGLREAVDELTGDLIGNADPVREELDDARFGSFDVVFASLNFEYSQPLSRAEHIVDQYEEQLTASGRDALTDLTTALSLFAPAREHVKTLYFQWALIELSQLILYAAVPAVAVAGAMVAVVDAGTFPGSTLGIDHIVVVVGGAFAVTLVPFMLFISYVLRILTVAKRTLAIEPLILRD